MSKIELTSVEKDNFIEILKETIAEKDRVIKQLVSDFVDQNIEVKNDN